MPQQEQLPLYMLSPRTAGETDVVGWGGAPTVDTLVWAYRSGIFPWPHVGYPLLWFSPRLRTILDFAGLHVPRRLSRYRKAGRFTITFDTAFDQVLTACRHRPNHESTWITDEIEHGYSALHRAGFAHSVEAWDPGGTLVGGLYGVSVDGVFTGESMFHIANNASKLALLSLIDHLQARGSDWLDCQVMTQHMAALGAVDVPRDVYLDRLEATQERRIVLF